MAYPARRIWCPPFGLPLDGLPTMYLEPGSPAVEKDGSLTATVTSWPAAIFSRRIASSLVGITSIWVISAIGCALSDLSFSSSTGLPQACSSLWVLEHFIQEVASCPL